MGETDSEIDATREEGAASMPPPDSPSAESRLPARTAAGARVLRGNTPCRETIGVAVDINFGRSGWTDNGLLPPNAEQTSGRAHKASSETANNDTIFAISILRLA
mmetsp:Transcript_10988/g.32542  ORF Transcript_10988/g.32542 Transcript_10988/m.32542 type:complete len:105 (+) Transcript_10988:1024-1338(+)